MNRFFPHHTKILAKASGFLLRLIVLIGLAVTSPTLYALDKVRLQLRFDHQFQFAGYYAAQWQGYYEQAGLEVEIIPGVRSNKSMLNATDVVRRGAAEFGIGSGDILMAIDQGSPLQVVASIFQQSPVALFAQSQTELTSPADLTRLKVLADPNPLVRAEIYAMLYAEGIDPDAVKFIPFDKRLSIMDRIEALMQGELDVVSGDEISIDVVPGYSLSIPWYARERGITLSSLRPSAYGVDFYGDSLFTTSRLIEEDPDLVQRFRDASIKGWEYALAHLDKIIDQITTELPRQLPVADLHAYNQFLATRVIALMNYPIIEVGHINPKRWERMHELMRAAGVVHNPLPKTNLIFQPERLKHDRIRAWLTHALEAAVAAIIVLSLIFMVYLLRAKRRAEESERHYKALFNDSPASIWEQDFSDTKQYLDEQLAASSLTARELLESRADVLAECAQRVRILNVNRATLPLFKADTQDQLMRGLASTFTDDSLETFREELLWLKEGYTDFESEARVKTLDGDMLHVDLRLSVLPSARENWERVIVLITDITARKHDEELLNRYKIMISTTADMMAYVSRDYRYLTVNEGYCTAFLKDRNQIIGKRISDLLGEGVFQQSIKINIDRCLAGEHVTYEIAMPLPASGLRFLRVNYHPITGPSGVIDGLLVHLHDLTNIKALERELVNHQENLEQLITDRTHKLTHAMQELESFSYAVSHDLRAPLRAIRGFSLALTESYRDLLDDKGKEFLERINRNTQKMGEQIDGLLSLSRINRGDLRYEAINLSSMSQDLADKYQPLYADKSIAVSVQPDIGVFGDKHIIEIAMDNLIGNAFKFSSRSNAPHIEIGTVDIDDIETVYIRDNGIGFDMQFENKLFAVFQRLQSDFEGTGIGLATVQRVISRHGGKVWANSSIGNGATFYFNLPSVGQVATLEAIGGKFPGS